MNWPSPTALPRVSREALLRHLGLVLTALLCLVVTASCEERADPGSPVSTEPRSKDLPDLELKDDTKDVLLTWVDEKGDFHVVMKTSDVPAEGRTRVRVVLTKSTDGTGDTLHVADLTRKNSDGSYPISTMSRSAWDEIGASKRKSRMEALAPKGSAAPSGSTAPPVASGVAQKKPGKKIYAIVYGADWCKPCHAAEDYLKKKGVSVVKKDVDNDPAAAAEMKRKLTRAKMGGASIPVIDIMGRLLVGYSPRALDRAVASVRSAQTL